MGSGRVVIVEDERIVAMELEDRLTRMGYEVVGSFGTGEQAIAEGALRRPDLVLLDIRLGGAIDGVQVAEALKRHHVPVVFLSAYADDETLVRAKATEPLGYVLKPFDERALQATIETALFRHRAEIERRAAEQAMRRAEARFAAILDDSPDAIVSINHEQRITVFNRAAERMFGYRADEVLGGPLDVLVPEAVRAVHRNHVSAFAEGRGSARAMGERGRLSGRRNDGTIFPIEASISKLVYEDEIVLTAVMRDVSRQLELEDRLRHVQKIEAVGRLASTVVHDVNNLLAVIQHAADLMRREGCDSADGHLETITAAVDRGAALTRNLLLHARKQPPRAEVVAIDDMVNRMQPLVANVAGEAIHLAVQLDAADARVLVDPQRLEQVLLNCIANARDAMLGGAITMRTRTVRLAAEATQLGVVAGAYALVTVEDNGAGIAPEILPRVFDPFFTTKEPGRGTGLGLSTARDVVREAGGAITVQSELGRGTKVSIYLPTTEAPAVRTLPRKRALDARHDASVLVVDDHDHLRRLVARSLELRGFKVRAAAGVGEALSSLEARGGFDVLITDVVMPLMSGPELAQRLRRYLPRLKVVYMTGYGEHELPQVARGDVVLAKPFSTDDLIGAMDRLLRAGGDE